MQITDGYTSIEANLKKNIFQIQLSPKQYKISGVEIIKNTLHSNSLLLAGNIEELSQSKAIISYELPKFTKSLDIVRNSMKYSQRIALALKLNVLNDWQNQNINIFISPQNIFVVEGLIKVAYRGFENVMDPKKSDFSKSLIQYKALVVSTINAKYKFEKLIDGSKAVHDKFERSIMDAKDADEITSLLQEQYRKVTADQIPVKKKNYAVYKYGFVISIVLLVVLGGFMIYRVGIKEPAQNRVIDSQSAFMSSDYNKTIDILENDNPRKLSKPAQYILATSYINLDNLTNKQKKMLLNNISPQSDSNTLLYWIYTGRGDFKTALNLAKNIGDNQLTLYAYTKLYDVTKADNNMNGSKKQKLLSSYRISIKKYVKELGGKSNGIEK